MADHKYQIIHWLFLIYCDVFLTAALTKAKHLLQKDNPYLSDRLSVPLEYVPDNGRIQIVGLGCLCYAVNGGTASATSWYRSIPKIAYADRNLGDPLQLCYYSTSPIIR